LQLLAAEESSAIPGLPETDDTATTVNTPTTRREATRTEATLLDFMFQVFGAIL